VALAKYSVSAKYLADSFGRNHLRSDTSNIPWRILHVFLFQVKAIFSWLECGWNVREMALVDF
jgi:hypothetical protein